ncbi:MAG: response regulator [Rhabdochlamydiaceae bacterium]|nr:response regulator [Rhabdochlamydiaceae bacterium]
MQTPKKKILIADAEIEFLQALKSSKKAEKFSLEVATTGSDCLKKMESFKPDLLIVDFMLPEIHGIELLKTAKNNQSLRKTGVILTSYHPMIQNYQIALKLGANYFIEKPITQTAFFELIEQFFAGTLNSIPFPPRKKPVQPYSPSQMPKSHNPSYLKLWGTRGSNPVAGAEYVRFGGNTPCLEIRNGEDLVIIDAGSGVRALGQILPDHPGKEMHILLSHTHWDHLLGFPFFYPIYQSNREIHIWSPVGFEKSTKELFADMLAHAYFPVSLDDIQSSIFFHDLRDGQSLSFGSIQISTHYAFHPGPTLCFKISIKNKTIGYVTDNEFLMGNHLPPKQSEKKESLFTPYAGLLSFLSGCDLLIHEAQYRDEEYLDRVGWGHSSLSNASVLLKKTGIKKWVVTHHDPRHTDEYLLQKQQEHISTMEELKHECLVQFAYDGMMISVD